MKQLYVVANEFGAWLGDPFRVDFQTAKKIAFERGQTHRQKYTGLIFLRVFGGRLVAKQIGPNLPFE